MDRCGGREGSIKALKILTNMITIRKGYLNDRIIDNVHVVLLLGEKFDDVLILGEK